MWTWDYRGFLIEPVLIHLEHIFDPKIWDFFTKMIFWMWDKSARSADNNEKMLGKLCITYFNPNPYIGYIHNANFDGDVVAVKRKHC